MDFKNEITLKVSKMKPCLELKRIQVFERWGEYLFISKIYTPNQLNEIQIAFLTLLTDKYELEIYPSIKDKVYQTFYEFYEEEIDEINIYFQALDIRNIESGKWQIMYEDDTIDPVVHVYFKGWDFDYSGLTG